MITCKKVGEFQGERGGLKFPRSRITSIVGIGGIDVGEILLWVSR